MAKTMNLQTVQDDVAVVSGGATGIGLAIVRTLLGAGYRVAFFSHEQPRIAAVQHELAGEFSAARFIAETVDLRHIDEVRGFFNDVTQKWRAPSALVCNAGASPKRPEGGRAPLADIDLAQWNDVLAVNLTGAMLCCQAVLPQMVQRKFGRIAFIGSVAGRTMPRIASASYVASKSALVGLARSIVSEYSSHGITVNTICPGRIITTMTGPAETPANRAALERIPIGRLGTPEDIARVVEFVLRPESAFINGAVLDVNGGEFTPA